MSPCSQAKSKTFEHFDQELTLSSVLINPILESRKHTAA